jgi:hypothetical protein
VKAKVATKDKGKGKAKDVSRTASSTRKVQIEADIQDEDMDDTVDTTNPNHATTSTAPFDFASFVPTHDPSLGLGLGVGVGVGPGSSAALPPAFGQPGQYASASASASTATGENVKIVSRDEAFQNALSSMYWTGYWTAAYYVSQILLSPLFSLVVLELTVW